MKFWQQLLYKLQENKKVYLLTVIENSGSSPGRKGFKMLVSEDDFIFGSVGGGVMEFSIVEEVRSLLKSDQHPIFFKKQIHQGKIKDGSGMICSGEQTVVFHPLNKNHITTIELILDCLANNKQKTVLFSPTTFELLESKIDQEFDCKINSETDWVFKEKIGYKETLYIVGGGHVSLAVSDLFIKLGFHVIVFDNRRELNTLELNKKAHQKSVINYNDIENYITEGTGQFIAIMTNKYTDDKLVLSKLIKNKYQFIGVLGSKAKLKTMWEVMLKEGFTQLELDAIYAPIGIAIKSQTPEEIAVSIAAQIISIKNANK
jgi:xanthine dehydrogenase accessory factor